LCDGVQTAIFASFLLAVFPYYSVSKTEIILYFSAIGSTPIIYTIIHIEKVASPHTLLQRALTANVDVDVLNMYSISALTTIQSTRITVKMQRKTTATTDVTHCVI